MIDPIVPENVPRGVITRPAAGHAYRLGRRLQEGADAIPDGGPLGALKDALSAAADEADALARSLAAERR